MSCGFKLRSNIHCCVKAHKTLFCVKNACSKACNTIASFLCGSYYECYELNFWWKMASRFEHIEEQIVF